LLFTYLSQNARQAKDLLDLLREAKQSINPKLYDMVELAKTMHKEKSEFDDLMDVYHTCVCSSHEVSE
jgi:hypothetical protein